MKRRDLLKTIIGFVGMLGTTKLMAIPNEKEIQSENIKSEPIKTQKSYKHYGIHSDSICVENNWELEILDIVYSDKNGHITKEQHGNPIGIVTQTSCFDTNTGEGFGGNVEITLYSQRNNLPCSHWS